MQLSETPTFAHGPENEVDIQLLQTDPAQLVVKYRSYIRQSIRQYLFVRADELDDLVQDFSIRLLDGGLLRMQASYDGRRSVKNYLRGYIRNLCSDEYKKTRSQKHTLVQWGREPLEHQAQIQDVAEMSLLLQEELLRLQRALALFSRNRSRFELCLKLFVRQPIAQSDWNSYSPMALECIACHDASLSEYLLNGYREDTDKDIFARVIAVLNCCEGTDNTSDSLRKWSKDRINQLCNVLNGDPPMRQYTPDSLQVLLAHYFQNQREA
jgi:RNA polymerase sigma factor (sigma-70 family)